MYSPIAVLARERAIAFRRAFVDTTGALFRDAGSDKLYHAGEYGSYRERLLKHLLAAFMPAYLGLSEGFVIDGDGDRSTQTDVIIFDTIETPKLETGDLRRFFPTDTICAVGEVKSTITVQVLRSALENKHHQSNETLSARACYTSKASFARARDTTCTFGARGKP